MDLVDEVPNLSGWKVELTFLKELCYVTAYNSRNFRMSLLATWSIFLSLSLKYSNTHYRNAGEESGVPVLSF